MRDVDQPSDGVRRRFSYANVVSTLALFLFVAGGSVAIASVSNSEVRSKHVKDNALKSKDLKMAGASRMLTSFQTA